MKLNTWKVIQGLPPYTPVGWEVTDDQRTESYWFKTREFAQICADLFNRLEDIKNCGKNISTESVENIIISPIRSPKLSDWTCYLFGSNGDGVAWKPADGKVPNWFWRKMQYLFFGNKWVKK